MLHYSYVGARYKFMLEKPDLSEEKIITCLQAEYGLFNAQVTFLPLGADRNTAVYRVMAEDGTPYFLKLRSGPFDETCVALPKFYSDQGVRQIIAPLVTKNGKLWGNLDIFKTVLYPFVDGHNAYEVELSDHHWMEFGTALKDLHTTVVPNALTKHIRRENYSPKWREIVKTFMERIETDSYDDPIAIKLATFLQIKRPEVLDLVQRAGELAQMLQAQPPELIVCHSDIHAGNLLIGTDGAFYIVDWDEPILAPKERDLMYVGGSLMASGRSPQEEETLFYRSYGQTAINPIALAYYRYERIVRDIAEYCEQLLLTDDGGEDREQSLHYLKSNFLPNGTIEIAYHSDKTSKMG